MMSPRMPGSGARIGVWFGLIVFLPILTWVFAMLQQAIDTTPEDTAFTLNTIRTLFVTLSVAVPIGLPWFADCPDWSDTLLGPLLVVMISLPLFTMLWLTGDVQLPAILFPMTGIAVVMVSLSAALRLLAASGLNPATVSVVQTTLCVAIMGWAWALRDEWLKWAGL